MHDVNYSAQKDSFFPKLFYSLNRDLPMESVASYIRYTRIVAFDESDVK